MPGDSPVLTEALRLDPKFVRVHYSLGQALQAQGKNEEAQREFRLHAELLGRNRSSQSRSAASDD
jgi:Tfp pilus assembly protein PilF